MSKILKTYFPLSLCLLLSLSFICPQAPWSGTGGQSGDSGQSIPNDKVYIKINKPSFVGNFSYLSVYQNKSLRIYGGGIGNDFNSNEKMDFNLNLYLKQITLYDSKIYIPYFNETEIKEKLDTKYIFTKDASDNKFNFAINYEYNGISGTDKGGESYDFYGGTESNIDIIIYSNQHIPKIEIEIDTSDSSIEHDDPILITNIY